MSHIWFLNAGFRRLSVLDNRNNHQACLPREVNTHFKVFSGSLTFNPGAKELIKKSLKEGIGYSYKEYEKNG